MTSVVGVVSRDEGGYPGRSMRALLALAATVLGCSNETATTAPVDGGGEVSGEAGVACTFNRDCPAAQRCDCAPSGCACAVGARGAGRSGVDPCASALDCESGLCVEAATGMVCSGPCDAGCGEKLPRCVDVAGIGPICARDAAAAAGAVGDLAGRKWSFDRAFFGYDFGDAGATGTALELHAGSDGTCPPPTRDPQATVVVAGLPAKLAAATYPGLKATLLGFDAALPVKSTASSVELEVSALEPCPPPDTLACAFAVTVSLAFPEGTIAGTVRAVRCPSMDLK